MFRLWGPNSKEFFTSALHFIATILTVEIDDSKIVLKTKTNYIMDQSYHTAGVIVGKNIICYNINLWNEKVPLGTFSIML